MNWMHWQTKDSTGSMWNTAHWNGGPLTRRPPTTTRRHWRCRIAPRIGTRTCCRWSGRGGGWPANPGGGAGGWGGGGNGKPGVPCSDYINANWVDGLVAESKSQYISTQGPLPDT